MRFMPEHDFIAICRGLHWLVTNIIKQVHLLFIASDLDLLKVLLANAFLALSVEIKDVTHHSILSDGSTGALHEMFERNHLRPRICWSNLLRCACLSKVRFSGISMVARIDTPRVQQVSYC